MLSRIAESVYWMSRHLERADNTARLLDINLLYMLETEDGTPESAQWSPLLSIVEGEESFRRIFTDDRITGSRVVRYMAQERGNPGSIYNSMRLARESARVVRDRISQEMWEAINEFWLQADRHVGKRLSTERAAGFFDYVREEVARFHGLTVSTMMRGDAFGFYLLGTFIERADMTARILDVKYHRLLPDVSLVGSPLDYYQWGALLRSLSGFEAYRRRYHGGIRPVEVAELAILEPAFPRSLGFCVARIAQAVGDLGTPREDCAVCDRLAALQAHLHGRAAEDIVREGLHDYLEKALEHLALLHGALQREYFDLRTGDEMVEAGAA